MKEKELVLLINELKIEHDTLHLRYSDRNFVIKHGKELFYQIKALEDELKLRQEKRKIHKRQIDNINEFLLSRIKCFYNLDDWSKFLPPTNISLDPEGFTYENKKPVLTISEYIEKAKRGEVVDILELDITKDFKFKWLVKDERALIRYDIPVKSKHLPTMSSIAIKDEIRKYLVHYGVHMSNVKYIEIVNFKFGRKLVPHVDVKIENINFILSISIN